MTRFSLITATTLLALLPAAAQDRRPPGEGQRLNFLSGLLSLTDTQKEQARVIFDAASQASESARGELTAARNALRDAVKANRAETELDRLAAAVGDVEGKMAGIQAKASAKFYALLTTEQKQKYDEIGTRAGPPGRFGAR